MSALLSFRCFSSSRQCYNCSHVLERRRGRGRRKKRERKKTQREREREKKGDKAYTYLPSRIAPVQKSAKYRRRWWRSYNGSLLRDLRRAGETEKEREREKEGEDIVHLGFEALVMTWREEKSGRVYVNTVYVLCAWFQTKKTPWGRYE